MVLKGADGDQLTLSVYGYQFPSTGDEYDDNWLLVDHTASRGGRAWRSIGAILLTWEVAGLADWFDALAVKGPSELEFSFLEPNLRFACVWVSPNHAILRIFFELESRPNWARDDQIPEEEFWLDVPVRADDLKTAAAALREVLTRFPYRGAGERPRYPMV